MSVHTRSQKLAQAAFKRVTGRLISDDKGKKRLDDKYETFAKKFPALIHTCGLAQAVAFAEVKGKSDENRKAQKPEMQYLEDLAIVLSQCEPEIVSATKLAETSRNLPLSGYLRLSRDAINAAGWLKRYVEAASPEETTETAS